MEREAKLLRCAKLNCYTEFNRMVHAIARSGGETGFQPLSGARMVAGNNAEYFFYTTLASMLNQVVRNTNSVSQQMELQQVYDWFCTNKPLIAAKTSIKHQRPKLPLSSRSPNPLCRPQTAPATLCLFPPSSSVSLPSRPCSHGHPRTVPVTSQSVCGFTSGYMSHSLTLGQRGTPPAHHSRVHTPSHTCRHTGRTASPKGHRGSHQSQGVSVVEVPAQQAPSHSGHGQSTTLSTTTLLRLAPAVAASMEWQREMRQVMVVAPRSRVNNKSMSVKPTITGNEETWKKEIVTDKETTSFAEPSPQQDDGPHTPPAPPPLQPSNITHSHTRPHTPHTIRAQPPVHVVTLGLPLSPQHTLSSIRRTVPSRLKRCGPKAGSGFNCSRYKPGSERISSALQ